MRASTGDLRENAEYKAAKERQEYLQARIGMLKQRVAQLSLLNLDRIPRDSIIAREYGIPCVTGVQQATALIHPGDQVTVDGYLGIVIIG